MVAEADESDGTFAYLQPLYSVVTNIEMEHVDYYKRLHDVLDGYSRFVNNTKRGGALFYNNDDENVRKILKRYKGTREGWGLAKGALIYPTNIKMDKFQTSYKCVYKNRVLGTVRLRIPGIHNVSNSLAAILVGMKMGIDFGRIAEVLAGFTGAKRRFQLKFHSDGVMLIDDYAHHPTEIRAVIEASQNWRPKRLMAVFQPHRFTRTKYLRREFGTCFHGVDKLILTDIYTASERPISGVTIHTIYREVRKSGLKDVRVMKKEDIVRCVLEEARPGDMVLVMGAGDIKEVADRLARSLVMRSELRRVPGRVLFGEPLSAHTTFRIGGSADAWVEPRDTAALKKVLEVCDGCGWRVFVIGNGSNILARDEGWRGVVVCLSAPHFKRLAMKGERVTVGAGYNLGKLITRTCRAGLAGLESMVGIPGTIGGAIYMNAGGASNPMFSNIGACVKSVRAIDYHGRVKTLSREDLMFRYRSSNLSGYVILGARLKLSKANRHMLLSQVLSFLRLKKAKQVLDIPSAGCIFKNPPDSQFTAGQLIDMMGFKGMRVGGAEVSAKHANFIVNTGGATAEDVLALVESIRRKAQEVYRIPLELEVKLL
jgi:UDP-N-acetylenolpyruvoylglucosamine reductase